MEQPKKPGPGRDITDLKARLGLAKGSSPPAPGLPGVPPFPGATPTPPVAPFPNAAPPAPFGAPTGPFAPSPFSSAPSAPASAPGPVFNDPFASMRPPEGKHFDLQTIDDGRPVINVQQRAGLGGRIIMIIGIVVAAAVGFGFGASAVGRRMFNQANFGAKRVKSELEDMQKQVAQIGQMVAMSQQRLAAAKNDALTYDPKLISDFETLKLDPRPDTSRIFKVNYYLLEDLAIDRLMNYYYDTIILFGEVERHIKRTKADKSTLDGFVAKLAQKQQAEGSSADVNYGVVFASRGKLAIGNLVEVGKPACKAPENCPSDVNPIEGFEIRSNTGAPWSKRKVGPKPEGDKVVPIERTPLFEAVMSGSPDQVRMEQYKQRIGTIRQLLARLAATYKELGAAINKAAERQDLFTI